MAAEYEVGDGVSVAYVSDYYPYTVIEVRRNGKEIVIQEDKEIREGGEWPYFKYEYERNPNGRKSVFSLRKNGKWRERGSDMRHTGARLVKGRRYYQDPHF